MKSILKEILIIVLLCCAICLILGVVFYDYIPTNKVVPSTVEAYKTSNTVKEEINQEVVDYPKQNISFEITESDLRLYEQEDNFNSGKANPFAIISSNVTTGTNTSSNGGSSSTTTNNNTSNPDSTDHFFNNTGLK